MEGGSNIFMRSDGFEVTNPNIYARSILFGTMFMELGDSCVIQSTKHDFSCTLEFKQKVFWINKGFFGGNDKDGVTGKLVRKSTGDVFYKIKGKWSEKTIATDVHGKEHILFNGATIDPPKKNIALEDEQEDFESRKYS